MKDPKSESTSYARLGASSSKAGMLEALGHKDRRSFFADPVNDVCGDPNYYSLLHADGAGTKSIVAYLAYRETGDPKWFRGLAQDSLVMNLDDLICVGAFEGLTLSNAIGRNRRLIPDSAIGELVKGYRELVTQLESLGLPIQLSGGETADLGDLVRTLVVDSTMFARVKRNQIISTDRIQAGDVIVGLSGVGKTSYESAPNSSIGSNGMTLARHALIPNSYSQKYPEIKDPALGDDSAYQGRHQLFDTPPGLGSTLAEALLSPTRTYAPVIHAICKHLGPEIHGLIHCSGGGQTKIINFGQAKSYVKDNLFPCPPIFSLIQSTASVPWSEMYAVFNMGHRLEVVVDQRHLQSILQIARTFNIDAQAVGRVEESADSINHLVIKSDRGTFEY